MNTLNFRIGHGYDVHKLVPDRQLILGGVRIPHSPGLLGHSDADVLVHSIMDAVLGALALGDIGRHFPDNDVKYKGADSLALASITYDMISNLGYQIGNIDATIIAQKPKLAPYINEMIRNISSAYKTDPSTVNVKATTEEGLGFTGSGEGIAAHAVVLLIKK